MVAVEIELVIASLNLRTILPTFSNHKCSFSTLNRAELDSIINV